MNGDEAPYIDTKKPKKSILLRVLMWFFIGLISLVLLAIGAAWLMQDKIKARVIAEVNEQVNVPIEVKGEISFSLLRHFPYASLSFEQVSIQDKLRKKTKLISVQEFSFLCNIYSLFGSDIEISKVVISGGEINVYKDANGKVNYDIIKPSKEKSQGSLGLHLKKAELRNVKFTFIDKVEATDINIKLGNAFVKGNFGDNEFDLYVKSKMKVHRINVGGEQFLEDKNLTAELTLDVDKLKQKYTFKGGKLGIEDTEFNISGYFSTLKNITQVDFELSSAGKEMQQLFALVPARFATAFEYANGKGEYAIKANIKGTVGKNSFPNVKVDAEVKDSELQLGKYNKFLKNVNAKAYYTMDANGNDKLEISNFNCTLNDKPFNFRLSLLQLSNPSFDFYANGVLHLAELTSFVPDSVIQDIDGTITFRNFHLKGKKADFSDVHNSSLTGGGEFVMSDIEFRQNGITYGNIHGTIKYEDQVVEAVGFGMNFLSTDFVFSGVIRNLFPFVYNLSEKRSSNNVILGVDGKLKVQTFNLSNILETYNKKNRPQAQVRSKLDIREVISMQGRLDVEIGRFVYREMQFNDLDAMLTVSPGNIQVNSLQTKAMGGEVRAKGNVLFREDNALNLNMDVSAVGLDIPKIFTECENFGQLTLTDRHLKGTITTSITFNATWLNYKDIDMNNLSAIVDFSVKDGALVKFEPLEVASKFIRLEELQNIRFSELSNTIKIANRRIDIPEFEIKSNALNLILFGHHGFDNVVDYHFKINLHKLLANKFRRNTNQVQYIEDDPYEGLNLYLSMSGPLDNPAIKFDKASSRNKIKEDFRKEREEMKNLLSGKAPKVNEAERKREDKYFDVKETPQFIEFEEEEEK